MVIRGNIDEIRFRNDENGYTILVLDVGGAPLVVVGNFPPVSEGEDIEAEGELVNHPKFGRQFKADKVKNMMPDNLDGLIRYLGSGLIKGVGPKTAAAIVNRFKEKTPEILEFNPFLLSSVRGISKEKALSIGDDFKNIKNMREAVMFLQGNGISVNLAVKIYKVYGNSTEAVVKSNPYKLYEDVDGIGFITADRIAAGLGISKDSEIRIRAGIICALNTSGEKNGNTFLPDTQVTEEASELLKLDASVIEPQIDELVISSKLRRVESGGKTGVMLTQTYRAEKAAAVKLTELIAYTNKIFIDPEEEIKEFERALKIQMHPKQKDAVFAAVNNGVSVITGGPGTGKTTIIKCILAIFDKNKITYSLMAPTGRAAKRLSESTGKEASTIHRALMLTPGEYRDTGETQSYDAVIVDEFSMVDVFLCNALLSRLKRGARLIIIGDKDQLPSVGAGNVLADIISSGAVKTIFLTEIYRQGEKSLIAINAHAINNGLMPDLSAKSGDFFYLKASGLEEIAEAVVNLAAERIPAYLNAEAARVQILSPVKNGAAGTNNLNRLMQRRLNGNSAPEIVTEEINFRAGDKVMHTANNYSLKWTRTFGYLTEEGEGVFNGDMGVITKVRVNSGEIDVLTEDNRLITYTQDIRHQLSPAYAVTIHKSQGSEFDGVIIPVIPGSYVIMTRNLLYTAITRAKKIVVLVGEEYNIKKMTENNYIAERYSMLKDFILAAQDKISLLYGN